MTQQDLTLDVLHSPQPLGERATNRSRSPKSSTFAEFMGSNWAQPARSTDSDAAAKVAGFLPATTQAQCWLFRRVRTRRGRLMRTICSDRTLRSCGQRVWAASSSRILQWCSIHTPRGTKRCYISSLRHPGLRISFMRTRVMASFGWVPAQRSRRWRRGLD